ncbi:Exopolyphosphatase, partial [Ceratobasidium sp. 423]
PTGMTRAGPAPRFTFQPSHANLDGLSDSVDGNEVTESEGDYSVHWTRAAPFSPASTTTPLVSSTEHASTLLSNMSALSTFFLNNKKAFLNDLSSNQGEGWTIVMDNEAGDLDSCASALAQSYLSTILDHKRIVALIQTPRADLRLRAENLLAFNYAYLDKNNTDLLTPDEITASIKLEGLRSSYALGPLASAERVTFIFDHHEDEHAHLDANPRIIHPAGSCASIVIDYLKPRLPPNPVLGDAITDVYSLLLTAIMIDTGGLEDNSKTTEYDTIAANYLYPHTQFGASSLAGGENKDRMTMSELANVLVDKKRDVSELSGHDLLRRDYKEFEWNNSRGVLVRVGLSTVPMGLKHWIERDGKNKFWAAQDAWIKERKLDVSGVLTTFRTRTKNKHKREMLLVFPQTEEVADAPTGLEFKLYTGIESNSELGAEQKDIPGVEGRRARAWEQTEKQATRKQIAPAFKAIIGAS